MPRIFTLLVLLLLSFAVGAQVDQDNFHLYLIGDAGKLDLVNPSYRKFLQQQLNNDTIPSAIIFLGDNIYPKGMPDEQNQKRKKAEDILRAQLSLANNFRGKVFFVPGNHDWKRGSRDGLQQVLNEQAWV